MDMPMCIFLRVILSLSGGPLDQVTSAASRMRQRAHIRSRGRLRAFRRRNGHSPRLLGPYRRRPRSEKLAATWRETAILAEALGHKEQVEIRFAESGGAAIEPADPLLAHADPDRLRQASMVLLDNAVRYSRPRGDVTISWSAESDALVAIVRDHGIGIDPAELPSLFVRYACGARARVHRAGGSGLGLAIAQAIMHAHGGQIGIESQPGVGTTVRISVPRWRGETAELP